MNYYEYFSKAIVQFRKISTNTFCGTGFLIGDVNSEVPGNFVFRLVTNKHIAEKKDLAVVTNLVKKIGQAQKIGKSVDSFDFLWASHPDADIDVASIPFPAVEEKLEDDKIEHAEKITFVYSNTFISISELDEGDEVFFLGFPVGLGTELPQFKPILRKGMIAFKKGNSFFIDGHSFPGNSGSPVFLLKKYDGKILSEIKLAGIINGNLPYSDICYSGQTGKARITFEENMGLSNAFSSDVIKETFKTIKK